MQMSLDYTSEWDFTIGCFEEQIFSLTPQGRKSLAHLARRKNTGKYSSVSDFMFAEIAGKHWSKATLMHYQGKEDILAMLLEEEKVKAWATTLGIAARILNSCLEFKSFSAFRRTVLMSAVKGVIKN